MSSHYVVGFVFAQSYPMVVLIHKTKPAWQRGLLNGIGGKIEQGESAIAAMVREAREETGIETIESDWTNVAQLVSEPANVSFFYLRSDEHYHRAEPKEEEPLVKVHIWQTVSMPVIRNLFYLLPLCLHHHADASGTRILLPVILNEV